MNWVNILLALLLFYILLGIASFNPILALVLFVIIALAVGEDRGPYG